MLKWRLYNGIFKYLLVCLCHNNPNILGYIWLFPVLFYCRHYGMWVMDMSHMAWYLDSKYLSDDAGWKRKKVIMTRQEKINVKKEMPHFTRVINFTVFPTSTDSDLFIPLNFIRFSNEKHLLSSQIQITLIIMPQSYVSYHKKFRLDSNINSSQPLPSRSVNWKHLVENYTETDKAYF